MGQSEGRESVGGEKPPAQEPRGAHTPWETHPWPSEQPQKELSKKLRTRRFATSANDCKGQIFINSILTQDFPLFFFNNYCLETVATPTPNTHTYTANATFDWCS